MATSVHYQIQQMSVDDRAKTMTRMGRRIGAAVITAGLAIGAALGTAQVAHAATVQGKSCGEKHPIAPEYYDAFGNAAPCTADFHTTAQRLVARITVDVVSRPGLEHIQQPHKWSVDSGCQGTVRPSDPSRSFTCILGPGDHTAYVDMAGSDRMVHLKVDY
jgi:hypothetical protein